MKICVLFAVDLGFEQFEVIRTARGAQNISENGMVSHVDIPVPIQQQYSRDRKRVALSFRRSIARLTTRESSIV